MRKIHPEEIIRGGFLRPSKLDWVLGEIQQVYEDLRAIKVELQSGTGFLDKVPLMKHFSGDFSLPVVGDTAVIIFNAQQMPLCIGYLEYAMTDTITTGNAKHVRAGEVAIYARAATPDKRGSNLQRLELDQQGNIRIADPMGDGFQAEADNKITTESAQTSVHKTAGGTMSFGETWRQPVPTVSATRIYKAPGISWKEFFIKMIDSVTQLETLRFHLGETIISELGIPEVSVPYGLPLRVVLEVMNNLGVEVASMKVDSAGDVIIKGTKYVIDALQILLGDATAVENAILGMSFMNQVYNIHSHPTGVGPSGPPNPQMTLAQLAKKVFVK